MDFYSYLNGIVSRKCVQRSAFSTLETTEVDSAILFCCVQPRTTSAYVLLRLRLPTWFSLTAGVTGTTVTVLLGTVVLLVSVRLSPTDGPRHWKGNVDA